MALDAQESSYVSLQSTDQGQEFNTFYDSDPDAYNWNSYEDDDSGTGYGGLSTRDSKILGWVLGTGIPAIIAIIVIAIIISIAVEIKSLSTAVVIAKQRSLGWISSVTSAFNEVDSERVLERM